MITTMASEDASQWPPIGSSREKFKREPKLPKPCNKEQKPRRVVTYKDRRVTDLLGKPSIGEWLVEMKTLARRKKHKHFIPEYFINFVITIQKMLTLEIKASYL